MLDVEIEFDEAKNAANRAKHGIALDFAIHVLDDPDLVTWLDERRDYGELRLLVLGAVAGRIHKVVYTIRGTVLRVISVRKANAREQRQYRQATAGAGRDVRSDPL